MGGKKIKFTKITIIIIQFTKSVTTDAVLKRVNHLNPIYPKFYTSPKNADYILRIIG